MRYISSLELKEKLDRGEDVQIIDTRDPLKYEECHLPGAVNIPQIDLPDNVEKVSHDKLVVIYCLYGVKSEAPFLYLREKARLRNVCILEGGIYQWANDVDQTLPLL